MFGKIAVRFYKVRYFFFLLVAAIALSHINVNGAIYLQWLAKNSFKEIDIETADRGCNCLTNECEKNSRRFSDTTAPKQYVPGRQCYEVSGKKYAVANIKYYDNQYHYQNPFQKDQTAYYFPLFPSWSVLDAQLPEQKLRQSIGFLLKDIAFILLFLSLVAIGERKSKTKEQGQLSPSNRNISLAVILPVFTQELMITLSILTHTTFLMPIHMKPQHQLFGDEILLETLNLVMIYLPSLWLLNLGLKKYRKFLLVLLPIFAWCMYAFNALWPWNMVLAAYVFLAIIGYRLSKDSIKTETPHETDKN